MGSIKKNCYGCRLLTSLGCKIGCPTTVSVSDCGHLGNLVEYKPTIPCPKPRTHAEADLIYSNYIEQKGQSHE